MKKFNELEIAKNIEQSLTGDKIQIENILNKEVAVYDFRIKESRYKKNGDERCLHLQVEVDGKMHVVFTGSESLMEKLEKVDKANDLPFLTTIKKFYRRFDFT